MAYIKIILCAGLTLLTLWANATEVTSTIQVNQSLWGEFNASERISILSNFTDIEVVPTESVGIIQAAQVVNRSTPGTNSGAVLGGVIGQAAYVDHAFKGTNNNYSALTQVGAALLGAAAGSALDKAPQSSFIINYGVRTLDGQVRELRVTSYEEFTRPIGQCVFLPSMGIAPPSLCLSDKIQFIKQLTTKSEAPKEIVVKTEVKRVNVICRVPGVGLMTLEISACVQVEGVIEK